MSRRGFLGSSSHSVLFPSVFDMDEALLAFATALAAAAILWPPEEVALLEAAREFCRGICWHCGVHDETEVFSELWVCLTSAMVQMQGLPGNDIGLESMGSPKSESTSPLSSLRSLNFYQRQALYKDMLCLKRLLPAIEKEHCSLAWLVRVAIEDVDPMLP